MGFFYADVCEWLK